MLAKIWENEVNRIDNVRLSIIEYFSSFVVYAKVPMRKIYGSVSVPEKVIKILNITYGIKRSFSRRKNFPVASPLSPSWSDRDSHFVIIIEGAEESWARDGERRAS